NNCSVCELTCTITPLLSTATRASGMVSRKILESSTSVSALAEREDMPTARAGDARNIQPTPAYDRYGVIVSCRSPVIRNCSLRPWLTQTCYPPQCAPVRDFCSLVLLPSCGAHFAGRLGRVRTLILTILFFSVVTLLSSFLTSVWMLALLRLLATREWSVAGK